MSPQEQNIRIVLTGDARGITQAGSQAERAMQGVGKAADGMRTSLQKSAASTMSQQRQLALVGPQLTDIGVGLMTGQAPLMVLLQQGGQLRDLFGSIGGAARAVAAGVAAMVTPFTIAAGAVTALVAAYYTAEERSAALNRALLQGGHAAGVSASGFENMVQAVSGATGASLGSVRDLGLQFVSTGQVGRAALGVLTEAATRMQLASGESADSVRDDLMAMTKGVTEWAVEHNRQWHFASAAQIDYIRQLEETQGKEAAMIATGELLNKHLQEQGGKVAGLTGLWRDFKGAIGGVWEALQKFVSGGTLDQRIDRMRDSLKELDERISDIKNRPGTMPLSTTDLERQRKALADRIGAMELEKRESAWMANKRSEYVQQQQRLIDVGVDLNKVTDKLSGANSEYAKTIKAIQAASEAGLITEQRRIELMTQAATQFGKGAPKAKAPKKAKEEKPEYDRMGAFIDDQLNAAARRDAQRAAQAGQYTEQLLDQTASMNAMLIADDRARGEAQIQIERETMQRRIDEWAAFGVDVTAAQDALNANIVARQQMLNEQLKPEWERMLTNWRDTTRLMADTYNNAMGRMLSEGESAWVQMARDGKFNISGLVNVIIEEFARLQYRQLIAPLLADGTNSLLNMMGLHGTGGDGMDAHVQEFNAQLKTSGDAAKDQAGQMNSLTGVLGRFGEVVLSAAQALMLMAANSAGGGGGGGGMGMFSSLFGMLENSNFFGDLLGITFAKGGMHRGGLRIVGENGPELEATGPSRIWNADQTREMLGGGGTNVTVHSTLVVNGGDNDRARLAQMLDARDARLKAELTDAMSRPGRAAYNAARS